MSNEFVQVTNFNSDERLLINLSDISFIRENKENNCSVIKLKNKDTLFFQVKENFDSFEEFFENIDND